MQFCARGAGRDGRPQIKRLLQNFSIDYEFLILFSSPLLETTIICPHTHPKRRIFLIRTLPEESREQVYTTKMTGETAVPLTCGENEMYVSLAVMEPVACDSCVLGQHGGWP